MRWTLHLAALAAVLAVAAAALSDVCRGADISTECRCDDKFTDLTLNAGDLRSIGVREKFVVQQCNKLQINKNSFRDVHNLKTFFINNVSEVIWKPGAFEHLEILKVQNVNSLNLNISSLHGAEGISSIYITNTKIPKLPKWSLANIKGLREFHLENVQIDKIEKDSIMLPMSPEKSDVVFQNCTINDIDEDAIKIKSTINFIMNKCIVVKASNNSVSIDHQNFANLTENIFKRGVEINAFNISGHNIVFENNRVETFTLNSIKNSGSRRSRLLQGFDELFVHGRKNNITCECPMEKERIDWSENYFKDNFCLHGCSSATVSAFLERCSKSRTVNYKTWIENICQEEGFEFPLTEQSFSSTDESSTDDPSTNISSTDNPSAGKRSSGACKLQSVGLTLFITTVILFCSFTTSLNCESL